MNEWDDNESEQIRPRPDGISCAGALIIVTLVLFTLGISVGRNLEGRKASAGTETITAKSSSIGETAGVLPAVDNALLRENEASEDAQETVGASKFSGIAEINAAENTVSEPENGIETVADDFATPEVPVVGLDAALADSTNALETAADDISPPSRPQIRAIHKPPPSVLPTPKIPYSWTLKVPILMYHYISTPPENADIYRQDLSVTPDNFRAQMQFLADNGYTTVDLYDLSLAIVSEVELPPKPVILTFDDGYRDNYVNAFPVLKELGLKGTFFVATEFVDQGNENYLSWEMVEEMAAAGMRFEPHSKTHPDLTTLDRDSIIWQVRGSQETIAAHTGYLPRYFAYPGGRYNDEVLKLMAELEFWGAVTTVGGKWHGYNDRYEWTRLRVRNATTIGELTDLLD